LNRLELAQVPTIHTFFLIVSRFVNNCSFLARYCRVRAKNRSNDESWFGSEDGVTVSAREQARNDEKTKAIAKKIWEEKHHQVAIFVLTDNNGAAADGCWLVQ